MSNISKKLFFSFLSILILVCLLLTFNPYLIIPSVIDAKQIPWTEPDQETPKAVIQFTFTSKVAFTTNYPIHVKIEIPYLKEETKNDTNLVIGIVNPPDQAYKTPLSEYPYSALIWLSTDDFPRRGELEVEFTASGSYGFYVLSGVLPELTNMTVAYVYNSALIETEPYNVRFTTELAIRGISITGIIGCITVFLERDKIFNKKRSQQHSRSKLKGRTTDLLRISLILGQLFPLTRIAIKLKIENVVPDSLAKKIVITCKFKPDTSILLKNEGVFQRELPLTYKDPSLSFDILDCEDSSKLLAQKLIYEATYLNEYNERIKQKGEITLAELVTKLEKDVRKEKFPSPNSEPFFPKS